jgi:hypothetical protein
MGIMMAVNSVVSHEMGAARFDRISHSVRESLWMGLGVGIAGCLAANLCTLVFDHIGLEAAVAERASTFLPETRSSLNLGRRARLATPAFVSPWQTSNVIRSSESIVDNSSGVRSVIVV